MDEIVCYRITFAKLQNSFKRALESEAKNKALKKGQASGNGKIF